MRLAFLVPAPDYPEEWDWAFDVEADALRKRGVEVDAVPWTEAADLSAYDLVLPMVVTGIVIVVQNSLALAFSLAGIAGAVRFRNSLKSSGDALFILLAVGIGLSAGIGALELAIVMTIAFNYTFLILWVTDYGDRRGLKKRYMTDCDPDVKPAAAAPPTDPI